MIEIGTKEHVRPSEEELKKEAQEWYEAACKGLEKFIVRMAKLGFGVFLLQAMEQGPDGIELYGVDLDRRACRATMVQLELNRRYNHRDVEYYIVNGDSLLGDFSWADANKW